MDINLTSEVIYGFTVGLLQERYDDPQPIPDFHRELWDYCCSEHKQVAIGAPRGHAKSTAITHAYTLASVLFRAAKHVLIVSDTEKQAVAFLQDIKAELKDNDKLRALFEIKRFGTDSQTEIEVYMGDDNHVFRIVVATAMGSMRGTKWRNTRPDLIICDDMENDEAIMNEDRREKLRQWFMRALKPAGTKRTKIRIVGTVLHFDSLLERLMPPTTGDRAKWTVTEGLKQYYVGEDAEWHSVKYRAHTDVYDFTEILWPEMFDQARLESIRNDYLMQGDPEGYSQEYLNYPIDDTTAFFRREDFIPMEKEHHNQPLIYYAAIDFAISEKQKRSWTVIVVAGVDSEGFVNIVDVLRGRWDAAEIIEEMMNVQIRYKPELFIMEEGALRKAMRPFLIAEQHRRGVFLNPHPMNPDKDKQSRARAIQGRMRQGGVRFDTAADWYPKLEQEMIRFPKGENDDQVDAIAWLGLVLNTLRDAPTPEELEQEEYDEELARDQEFSREGQSEITGY